MAKVGERRWRLCLTTRLVADLILKGEMHELKAIMTKSREAGMQTFDQALFDLYDEGVISYNEVIHNANSANELRLQIKLKAKRRPDEQGGGFSLHSDAPEKEDREERAI